MRPLVKTALRPLWRDGSTVQFGLDPEHAVVLAGISGATVDLLAGFDGGHDIAALRERATEFQLDPGLADRMLRLLSEAHAVADATGGSGGLSALPLADRDRLAPDLASLGLLAGAPDDGTAVMARRRERHVRVVGAGRVGAAVAALLAAAGIGQVGVVDDEPCRPADCAPGGAGLDDSGRSRAAATLAAIARASTATLHEGTNSPDVVVLAPAREVDHRAQTELMRAGTPHIVARVREVTGVIGPMVLPGATACLRCLDLQRADRDPAWPLLAAQLAAPPRSTRVDACDVALASLVASACALQVLGFLDNAVGTDPAAGVGTLNGTLEVRLPDWRIRRRSWSVHPACGCSWSRDHVESAGHDDEETDENDGEPGRDEGVVARSAVQFSPDT